MSLPKLTLVDSVAATGEDNEEVHTVNTGGGVIFDTKVNVLGDTEAKVTSLGEVALLELVLLYLEATLKNFHGLFATDGHVHGDLLVTTDTEGTHSVAGLGVKGLLAGKALKHTCGTSQTIATLTNAAVDDELEIERK